MRADLPTATTPTPTAPAIYRAAQLTEMLGFSRMTLWRRVRDGSFPSPVKIGPRTIGWKAGDVERWIESRPAA